MRFAFRAAVDGLSLLPVDLMRTLVANQPRTVSGPLSDREIDWLRRLTEGISVSRLADRAGYSERMMFRLLNQTYAKLGVDNRTKAIIALVIVAGSEAGEDQFDGPPRVGGGGQFVVLVVGQAVVQGGGQTTGSAAAQFVGRLLGADERMFAFPVLVEQTGPALDVVGTPVFGEFGPVVAAQDVDNCPSGPTEGAEQVNRSALLQGQQHLLGDTRQHTEIPGELAAECHPGGRIVRGVRAHPGQTEGAGVATEWFRLPVSVSCGQVQFPLGDAGVLRPSSLD